MKIFANIFVNIFVWFFLFALSFAFATPLAAQELTIVNNGNSVVPLKGQQVLSAEDQTHALSLEHVRRIPAQKWTVPNEGYTNLGISSSAYWLTFKVLNHVKQPVYLQMLNPVLDSARLYVVQNDSVLLEKEVLAKKFEMRVPSSPFVLPFSTDTLTCYVRVTSRVPLVIMANIIPQTYLTEHITWLLIGDILFFGAAFVMILYNLILGITTRNSTYFYYVAYSFFVVCVVLYIKGYPAPMLGSVGVWVNDNFAIFASLAAIFLALFTKNFLQLSSRYSLGNTLLNVAVGLQVVDIAVFVVGFVNLNVLLFQIFSLYTNLCVLWAALYLYRKLHYKPALLFLIAFFIYLMLSSGVNLAFANVIAINIPTLYFLQIGGAIELTLFSIALGDKINLYRKEAAEAQAENLRLVQEQNIILEQKVTERTLALNQANEELNTTLDTVEHQRDAIISSINYALRIQNAIIPKEAELQKHLDCFVLFKPRDIVSGDFYWFAEKENRKILAVADCTGHGVSGAFMTMIGNNILNQIVHDLEIHQPNEILDLMSPLLEKTLLHAEGKVADGMDITIVTLEAEAGRVTKLHYAGAMNPLFYVQNQTFTEIKADKMPISAKKREKDKTFTRHTIPTDGNGIFYLLSDGYQDQFGGPEHRKFMVKRFKQLLSEIADKPLPEQRRILETTFDEWKAGEEQTDDMLVLGLHV